MTGSSRPVGWLQPLTMPLIDETDNCGGDEDFSSEPRTLTSIASGRNRRARASGFLWLSSIV